MLRVWMTAMCAVGLMAQTSLTPVTPERPDAPAPPLQALRRYLALDESQVEQLMQLQLTKRGTLRPIFQQVAEKERALREMLEAGNADATAVGTLLLEIEGLRKQIRAAEEDFARQSRAVLTAEQQEKLTALERVLRLEPAAHEAVRFQLIPPPHPLPAQPDPIEGVSRPHMRHGPH